VHQEITPFAFTVTALAFPVARLDPEKWKAR
jgi:hypothetical protein